MSLLRSFGVPDFRGYHTAFPTELFEGWLTGMYNIFAGLIHYPK